MNFEHIDRSLKIEILVNITLETDERPHCGAALPPQSNKAILEAPSLRCQQLVREYPSCTTSPNEDQHNHTN